MEKRKRRGYVYHDFVVRCGVFGNISWRRPRFFLRIQSLWSMSVYVSHLIDEVIGNQKESIVKRYVTFSSWFGESIHCERILTCGPQFFHFSFSAIKKSFPMFKSSTSRPLCRNVLWFCLILSGPCFFRKYSTFSTPFSFHPLSPFDSKDFYRYFNIFFFSFRFFSRNFRFVFY